MSFLPILVPSVCKGVWLERLGENKFSNPNSKIWHPLFSLSQPSNWVSVLNCLVFQKISISKQIWLKTQTPLFWKWFLGFVHLFEWMLIKISKFPKSMRIFSRNNSWSRGDRQNPELRAWKTKIFKMLHFEPNFRVLAPTLFVTMVGKLTVSQTSKLGHDPTGPFDEASIPPLKSELRQATENTCSMEFKIWPSKVVYYTLTLSSDLGGRGIVLIHGKNLTLVTQASTISKSG